jgi:hypothetical protein
MSFTANVPVSGQSLGNSRPTINANFTKLQTVYDVNHVDFNAMNAGAHTHVDLLMQATDPAPAVDLVSHYSKDLAGNTEWYFQRESAGPVIQMSTINGTPIVAAAGQTFLPGGLVMKFGTGSFGNGATTSNFVYASNGLPDFAVNVYSIQVTLITNIQATLSTVGVLASLTGFSALRPAGLGAVNYAWIAIGN